MAICCRNGQIFAAEVSSDRQCLSCPIVGLLCRLRPSDLVRTEKLPGHGGAPGGLCGSDDQITHLGVRKKSVDAPAMQENCSTCSKNEESNGTVALLLAERNTVKVRQTQVRE